MTSKVKRTTKVEETEITTSVEDNQMAIVSIYKDDRLDWLYIIDRETNANNSRLVFRELEELESLRDAIIIHLETTKREISNG